MSQQKNTIIRDGMRLLADELIPMDDGLSLRADIYLPLEEGQYPLIACHTAYAKNLPFSQGYPTWWAHTLANAPGVATQSTTHNISFEAIDPERWTPHGYAVMLVDDRGCGRSPGVIDTAGPREVQDYYDSIAWAAEQEWCNGKIGLCGMSNLAIMQWLVANRQPPKLAAMCVWEGCDDTYRAMTYTGGIPGDFLQHWYTGQVKSIQHGIGTRGYRNEFTGELVSGDDELTDDEIYANHATSDVYETYMAHPLDDGFYEGRRAQWDRMTYPLLSVGSWGAIGVHTRGNIEGFVNAATDQKWLVMRKTDFFAGLYSDEGVTLQRRFFDYVLKGEGDWLEQPPIVLEIRDAADRVVARRAESEWPLARTRWTKLFLDPSAGSLAFEPPTGESSASYRGFGEGLTFMMHEALTAETEVTGPIACKLWIASESTDADLFVTVRVFGPDGVERFFQGLPDPKIPLTQGWLRASQRKLDPVRSRPYRPYLAHDEVRLLIPGEVYEVDVEVWPTCVVLPAGYRLAVTIEGKDFDHGQAIEENKNARPLHGSGLFTHKDLKYRPPEVYDKEVTIFSSPANPSYVLFPIVPEA